jgi:hypothetical protein
MRSRCMSLLPRTTLHSDSEQVYISVILSSLVKILKTRFWTIAYGCSLVGRRYLRENKK